MQKANVYKNNILIATLIKDDDGYYHFEYTKEYLANKSAKAISINLKLQSKEYKSPFLFSFFANMLAEGSIKDIQCRQLRIDKDDIFSRLIKTTATNTIGSITLEEIK